MCMQNARIVKISKKSQGIFHVYSVYSTGATRQQFFAFFFIGVLFPGPTSEKERKQCYY